MDSSSSEGSESVVVHSDDSVSVVVHAAADADRIPAGFTAVARSPDADAGLGGNNEAGVGLGANSMVVGRPPRADALYGGPSLSMSAKDAVSNTDAGETSVNVRRLPRPNAMLRWPQVLQDSRPSSAPYVRSPYGRGGGSLGESLDAFQLYVADDGEMKMGDHHNDFYSFNYDPTDFADDFSNLNRCQLSANGGGGDFYADTEDSSYGSSEGVTDHRNSYRPGGEAAYENADVEDVVADRRNWAIEPALLNKNVSRRRRLLPKRRCCGPSGPVDSGSGDGVERRFSKGKEGRRPHKCTHGEAKERRGGSGTARMQEKTGLLLSYTNSTLQRNDCPSKGAAPRARAMVDVRLGAHVAAAAAAYPHLSASLGALVLLYPGSPTTNPLDKVARLRERLLRRQTDEKREYEKKQRARRAQETQQQQATGLIGAYSSPRRSGSQHHTASGAGSHNESANVRVAHPPMELKVSLEDLNRSTGPATARMGAGTSLVVLQSARQRAKESPQLQEVALKGEAVYVRANAADTASATGPCTDAGTQSSARPSSARSVEVMDGGAAGTASRQPRELRDPYTGVVISSSFVSAEEQTVPDVLFSRTAGILFFYDLTAPRPIAITDVVEAPSFTTSKMNSARGISWQPSSCAPAALPTLTPTYTLPSFFQQSPASAMRRSSQLRCSSVPTYSSHSSTQRHFSPPTVHLPTLPPSSAADEPADDNIDFARHAPGPYEDGVGQRGHAETLAYRDAHKSNSNERDAFLKAVLVPGADPRQGSTLAAESPNSIHAAGAYQMPSALAGGGGQRQRWRLHGGVGGASGAPSAAGGFDRRYFARNGDGAGPQPPWRWLYGPQLPHTSFSTACNASGCSESKLTGRKTAGGNVMMNRSAAMSSYVKEGNTVDGSAAATTPPPPTVNLRGFTNAREANWAELRNMPPSLHARGAGVPHPSLTANVNATTPAQLPLYPSLVAPYAAPRTPLQQNIRYNAWAADGVAASSGAACIVHVFTITREMLRSVYEYVAYTCVQRCEREAREREQARLRRMKSALTAGVLTRELQRCLRCPYCGIVGQVVKTAAPRNTGHQMQLQRSQLRSQAPQQLSQPMNQTHEMRDLQPGNLTLRVGTSSSNFAVDAQKQQSERGKHAFSSSERQTPRRQSMPPLPHPPSAPSMSGSIVHPPVAHYADRITDRSGTNAAAMEQAGHNVPHETATAVTEDREGNSVFNANHCHSAAVTTVATGTGNKEITRDVEGDATLATTATIPTTSPAMPTGQSNLLLPPPPIYTTQNWRLLSPTQHRTAPGGNTAGEPAPNFSPQPQNSTTQSSCFITLGAAPTASPTATTITPKKFPPSPTFASNTTMTPESADGNVETQLERSSLSHELSRPFASLQPQRASNAQSALQQYVSSSFINSGAGSVLPTGLFSSGTQFNLSRSSLLRVSQDRENSVRMGSCASDAGPGVPNSANLDSAGASDKEEELNPHGALTHATYAPARRSFMSPPQASCLFLPDAYLNLPNTSMVNQGYTQPNQLELTVVVNSTPTMAPANTLASAYSKHFLSSSSTLLVPMSATYGANSPSSTFLTPITPGQSVRLTPQLPPLPLLPQTCSRTSGNGSFIESTQPSAFTLTAPPLATSSTPLFGDAGANNTFGNNSSSGGNAAVQARDPFTESMSATTNRSYFSLARRYVCQSCHRDVVPKTSMVCLPLREDHPLPKAAVSDVAAPPTLVNDNTDSTRAGKLFGVLAFEDLFQDDALVQALQKNLEESLMLPATRPAQSLETVLTPAVPEAGAMAAGTVSVTSMASTTPHLLLNGSLSDLQGTHTTSSKHPAQPLVASVSSALSGWGSGEGVTAPATAAIDASRLRPTGAPPSSKEGTLHKADATITAKVSWPQAARPNSTSAPASFSPVPMQSFARVSLQSSSSSTMSPSAASVSSSARSKAAASDDGDEKESHTTPAGEELSVTKPIRTARAPLLLRLCVPCCGLKVSVLDLVKPKARDAPIVSNESDKAEQAASPTTTCGKNAKPKMPLTQRKSTGSDMGVGIGRQSKKLNHPPPRIPRMREDAATRGLTQSALLASKEPPPPKCQGREKTQRGRGNGSSIASTTRRLLNRRDGRELKSPTTELLFGTSAKTVMQDTDASKRHRVQVNSRMKLDATTIDRIWARLFKQNKNSTVAAVATGRDKSPAKRLKSLAEEAAHSPHAKSKAAEGGTAKSTSESLRPASAGQTFAEPLESADGAPSRTRRQHLGIDLDAYDDSSVVLKVELAYPRLPGGNVRQLLHEWVEACEPHPVLLEAVIRNVVYGVLTQLYTLHAAGYASGNVKSTNVFPMWHLMRATKQAGMKMPPRAATESQATGSGTEDKDSSFRRTPDSFNPARGTDKMLQAAAKPVGTVPTRPATAPASAQRFLVVTPTMASPRQAAREPPLLVSVTPTHLVGSVNTPEAHAAPSVTSTHPFGAFPQEPLQQPQSSPTTTNVAAYRRMSTKALQTTTKTTAEQVDNPKNNARVLESSSDESKISRSDEEGCHRQLFPKPVTPLSPTIIPMQLAPPMLEQKNKRALLTTGALSIPDAAVPRFDRSNSSSHSSVFPFSPALWMASTLTPPRRGRGFSADDSVICTGPRRKKLSGEAERPRTHSVGLLKLPPCRHSDSTQSSSEEREELVPLLVEVVTPSPTPVLATDGKGDDVRVPGAPQRQSVLSPPQPPALTIESFAARHSSPKHRGHHHSSTQKSFKVNLSESAAWRENARCTQRYVCGVQLVPPSRVLLPSLRSCADDAKAQKGNGVNVGSSASKVASLSAKEPSSESDDDEDTWMKDEAHSLLTSVPTGAVPRPKSRYYAYTSGYSTKSRAVGRISQSETSRDGVSCNNGKGDDDDALDPLQWSQQVMLVDNLCARVETALGRAMTTVLSRPPQGSARLAAQSTTSKDRQQQQQQQQRRANTPSSARAPLVGGSDANKSLHLYVPDLNPPTPPAQPVLFGIQESEYVPAPETIRGARDEARALWCLWRQQQRLQDFLFPAQRSNSNMDITTNDFEETQMEHVAAQLAEQPCPATMLRNTLDPYPYFSPSVDIWQLGMMALDLADGPVPSTWLKQREPTPRLNSYPWSSYFQSFVSLCLQVNPERRATAADLLHHPWFSVALVPQMTGGDGARGLRDNHLQPSTLSQASHVLPLRSALPPRVSCVMGVDCLTAEERKEWEGFDYTLLYAKGGRMHPLTSAPSSPVSSVVNGVSRLRRASANSPSSSANGIGTTAAGPNRAGTPHAGTSTSTTGLAAVSIVGDSAVASQSLGIDAGSALGGTSLVHVGSSANNNVNTTMNNGSGLNAAMISTVDTDTSVLTPVDLVQFFTRHAISQWRRLQQQQQQIIPSLATSLPGTGPDRGGDVGALALAGAANPPAPAMRKMGSALLNPPFFEHAFPISSEDVFTMFRQSSMSALHVQLNSPRQSLCSIASPRSPQPTTTLRISQAQQTDSLVPTSLLWNSHPLGAPLNGTSYGLPNALNAPGTTSPSLPPLSPLNNNHNGGDGGNVKAGLPSSYVPLRDPRVGGAANGSPSFTAATSFPAAGKGNTFVLPRISVGGERSAGATAAAATMTVGTQKSPQTNFPSWILTNAYESRQKLPGVSQTLVGGDGLHSYSDKFDHNGGDFSDAEQRTNGEDVEDISGSSYSDSIEDDSSEGDSSSNFNIQDQSVSSNNSNRNSTSSSILAYEKTDRAGQVGPGACSSSHSRSRSYVKSIDDSYLVNRGGGEVPDRKSVVVLLPPPPGTRWMLGTERAAMDAAAMPALVPPFSSTSVMPQWRTSGTLGLSNVVGDGRRRRRAGPRRHLLFGTLAACLARLSTVVGSSVRSTEDDDSSDGSSSSDRDSDIAAADVEGRHKEHKAFPDNVRVGRRQTQSFDELVWEDLALHADNPITAGAEGQSVTAPRISHTGIKTTLKLFSSAHAHARLCSEDEGIESSEDDSDDVSLRNIEVQCDELLRCFYALQRACPLAVSMWCVRMLQQATLHPRTSAAATRLLEQVEGGVLGGAGSRNLAWLSTKNSLFDMASTRRQRSGTEGTGAAAALSTTAATGAAAFSKSTTPPPQSTPSSVQDTCPSSFHNYELAKWLFAAHQTIPRCT